MTIALGSRGWEQFTAIEEFGVVLHCQISEAMLVGIGVGPLMKGGSSRL